MSTKRSSAPRSLTNLPSEVLVEILARLPLRTLVVSRSVCKTFRFLTTHNPLFIDLHSSKAAQILVLQFGAFHNPPSHLLRLADPELDSELKPLFQLPITENPTGFWGNNRLFLANSCNGLLYFFRTLPADDNRSLVCNPVTNEYIIIPEVDMNIRLDSPTKNMWLGFSPGSNQYKVLSLSIFSSVYWNLTGERFNIEFEVKAQVFVIGSESWRAVDDTPPRRQLSWTLCSAQVNGVMYLFELYWSDLVSFDFETEKFGEVALPAEFQDAQIRIKQYNSIGVLGGCVCVSCNDFDAQRVDLWVMRKCGNQDYWTKDFVVDTSGGPVHGWFKPLQFLRNGKILMLWRGNDLVCYDPRTETLKYFGLRKQLRRAHKPVAFTPSFVPLKDTLKVDKVLRQYVRPRGDEKELGEEVMS